MGDDCCEVCILEEEIPVAVLEAAVDGSDWDATVLIDSEIGRLMIRDGEEIESSSIELSPKDVASVVPSAEVG